MERERPGGPCVTSRLGLRPEDEGSRGEEEVRMHLPHRASWLWCWPRDMGACAAK